MLRLYIANAEVFCETDRFERACGLIDSVRLAKVQRCGLKEDKVRSLCCGLLLQYALQTVAKAGDWAASQRLVGADNRMTAGGGKRIELRYGYGTYGKPYFEEYPQFCFSLSHSGRYAVLAVSEEENGVDIQQRRPVTVRMARRVLTDREYKKFTMLGTEQEREDWFFRCWCAKESYGKLTGYGFSQDFRRICLEESGERIVHPALGPALCREYMPEAGYYMNVCRKQAGEEEKPLFPKKPLDVTQTLLCAVT